MIRNILTTSLAGVLWLTAFDAHAQTQQQVAFIGDSVTDEWGQQPQFTAHTNWLPDGVNPPTNGGTQATLAELQTIIKSGKKPIIHLMIGTDSYLASPGNPHSSIFASWAQGFEQIITTAQAAKLTIIVGTNPLSGPPDDESDVNKWIFLYCNAHNIPVINYDFAINSGTGFSASFNASGASQSGQPAVPPPPAYYVNPAAQYKTFTPQAWSLMTDMAQTAIIQAEGYKLKSGYLNTVVFDGNNVTDFQDYPTANANTVADGGYVQFTPYGQYTDGSTHIMNNADINGHIGTWNSSNPTVVVLDQYGAGRGMDKGSTNVHFTTLSGVTINEWVMYTVVEDDCSCTNY